MLAWLSVLLQLVNPLSSHNDNSPEQARMGGQTPTPGHVRRSRKHVTPHVAARPWHTMTAPTACRPSLSCCRPA